MTKKSPDQFFIDLSVLVKRLLNRTPQHMEVVHDKTFKTKNIPVERRSSNISILFKIQVFKVQSITLPWVFQVQS